eukprot:GEMP01040520.1.p1 GENE.GEMP01040520.1~~GEMP01040520.1.p1  ORF type:complete len:335 (+),score=65.83 GEMP01040520.1:73-1077(+)
MILATSDQVLAIGHGSKARSSGSEKAKKVEESVEPALTAKEIEEFSQIKCCVCDTFVVPDDIRRHSQNCVVPPAPNHLLQLDKWSIAAASMTDEEQRQFCQMRRKEERQKVEEIEQELLRPTKLWWLPGAFAYIISSEWMRDWRAFVGVGHSQRPRQRPPGPVNNSDLLGLEGNVRPNLKAGILNDYLVVEPPLWEFYLLVYSGGPPILRYNPNGQQPDITDVACEFVGEWKHRRPLGGEGKIFDPIAGLGFEGTIRNGYLHTGYGKGLLASGSHYEGHYKNGVPHGKGRDVLPDGTSYEGVFRNGKLHGFGCKRLPSRVIAEGNWVDGELCGI